MIATLLGSHLHWLTRARNVLATALLAMGAVALAALIALHDGPGRAQAAAAVLWLVASVGGLIAGARIVAAEHGAGGLRGVLLAPVDRRDVFLARSISVAIFVFASLALTLVLVALLFPGLAGLRDPRAVLALLVASLGVGPLGTLTGWAALGTRAGEVLAPGLALPIAAPLIVGGLHATERLLRAQPGWEASLTFAAGYALSVAALCYIVSESVVEGT